MQPNLFYTLSHHTMGILWYSEILYEDHQWLQKHVCANPKIFEKIKIYLKISVLRYVCRLIEPKL